MMQLSMGRLLLAGCLFLAITPAIKAENVTDGTFGQPIQASTSVKQQTALSASTSTPNKKDYYYYLRNGSTANFQPKDQLYVLIPPEGKAIANTMAQQIGIQFGQQLSVVKSPAFPQHLVFTLNDPSTQTNLFDTLKQTVGDGSFISPILEPLSGQGEIAISPQILVRFKDNALPDTSFQELNKSYQLKDAVPLPFTDREYAISLGSNITDAAAVFKLAREWAKLPYIEWTEPAMLTQAVKMNFMPNDSLFPNQWHLHNTGQNGALPDADIDAPEGWGLSKGDNVVIAIFDDGVQTDHPDLDIWVNAGEAGNGRESNGIDDDGNGFIDDYRGWDFTGNDNNPNPASASDNHGTSVAGVAGAKGNNAIGVSGSAPGARILPIRHTSGSCASWGNAMRYAGKYADVVNNSWSIGSCRNELDSAISDVVNGRVPGAKRETKGTPVLFATGNDASGWMKFTYSGVPAGTHTFEWRFSNDVDTTQGYNTVWLDDIAWPGGGNTHFDEDTTGAVPSGFSSSGNANWSIVADPTHTRGAIGKSAKAGTITANQTTSLTINRTVGSGTLSYWAWVSSEQDYDFLELYVDGSLANQYAPGQYTHQNEVGYPASNSDTIAVGASTDGATSGYEERIYYSQFGPEVDVVTPSNNQRQSITTTDRTGSAGYDTGSDYTSGFGGTSSATPLASGVVADILAFEPSLTASGLRQLLHDGADKIGVDAYVNGRNDFYGYGRVNLYHSLLLLDHDADGTPDSTDTDDDSDGMPDTWETLYGFNPLDPGDADSDADGDGLKNLPEYTAGTNPNLQDTDGDGINDKTELDQGRNPTVNEEKVIPTIIPILMELLQ